MLDPNKPLKIFLPQSGAITLNQSDYIASGGEGVVYKKGKKVFKIYLDPQKARAAGMEEKVRLLSGLSHPSIIAPRSSVYDEKGDLVGYTMDYCDGLPLVKTFTNSWRDKSSFGPKEAVSLVENMRIAVGSVHDMNALMVDGNEMNYLFQGVEPKLIDVDSWQIGRFKATAMMPSIRDYSSQDFSPLTDWFAWGIVSFQVLIGTHPYKGSHPDFKKGDLEARMRANASVFDKKVSLNGAVRDLSLIPVGLRDWYEGVFQQGVRDIPPSALAGPVKNTPKKLRVISSKNQTVQHRLLDTLSFEVQHVSRNGVAYGKNNGDWHAYDLIHKRLLVLGSPEIESVFNNNAALVRFGDRLVLLNRSDNEISGRIVVGNLDPIPAQALLRPLALASKKLANFKDTIYAITDNTGKGMIEVGLSLMGQFLLISVSKVWPLSENSTRFFNGVAIYDALGTPFVIIPDAGAVHTINADVLKGVSVVDAFARNSTFVAVAGIEKSSGVLMRYLLIFDGKKMVITSSEAVDTADINMVVTPKGIAVAAFDDDSLEVFSTKAYATRKIPFSGLPGDVRLFGLGDMVCYADGVRVYQLSLS
jgi:predicted Ser/Thr protein kinase